MGYRNRHKSGSYRARVKGPVKLAFGLVETKTAEDAAAQQPVVAEPQAPLPRQDIVGTLTMKKVDLRRVRPLPKEFVARVKRNLKQIYEAGRYSNSRMVIDLKDGELLVQFPFDQGFVDRIKGLDRNERAWDPDARLWRIFPGTFDDLLDILGKGVQLTKPAYETIRDFVDTPYYAFIGEGKLGKLIVRESWFEEIDIRMDDAAVAVKYGSTAHRSMGLSCEFDNTEADTAKRLVKSFAFARKPFAHQIDGIEYLLMNPEAALLDEMGCGKSFQIACAIAILLSSGQIDHALIVAPMSLLRTWQNELTMAGLKDFEVVRGTPQQRKKTLSGKRSIYIVHYEGLRIEEDGFAEWLRSGRSVMVFDESQRIKNLSALITKVAIRLRPLVTRCVIATGTPISNRPLDLYSQYFVMDGGQTFGVRFAAFKNTFCQMENQKIRIGRKTINVERFVGVRNGEELRSRIVRTSLRRLKSDVLDLPPILIKDYRVDLKTEQRTMYQQMRDNLRVEISSMSDQQCVSEASTIIVKLLRLSQIASNPALIDPGYTGSNAKVKELEELLDDILDDETKKVIVWSHYVDNVAGLAQLFAEKYRAVAHTGEQSVEERQESVRLFTEDPGCRLFVATPQSAKEGLTLLPKDGVTRADTMIYVDLSFDGGSYIQSQARFHRIGQAAERCLVIHLLADETVDEYIRANIVEKLETAGALLDDRDVKGLLGGQSLSKDSLLRMLS
jgi:SNF2 family DNA or RNA helicase